MRQIKLTQLAVDPLQPRQEFDVKHLTELRDSIAQHGVLQSLIVEETINGKYLIVDGERRYRCAAKLGLKEIPVEIVKPMNDFERLIKRFHIQSQHRNWSYFDKARAIKMMVEQTGVNPKELADLLGITQRVVDDHLLLLELSKRSQNLLETKKIPYAIFTRLSRIKSYAKTEDEKNRLEVIFVDKYLDGEMTSETINDYILAVREGKQKVIEAILKNKNLTSEEALDVADVKSERALEKIQTNARWFRLSLRQARKRQAYKSMTIPAQTTFKSLIKDLQDFVYDAGYVE